MCAHAQNVEASPTHFMRKVYIAVVDSLASILFMSSRSPSVELLIPCDIRREGMKLSNLSVVEFNSRQRTLKLNAFSKEGESSSTNSVQASTRNLCRTDVDAVNEESQLTMEVHEVDGVWKFFNEVTMEMIITCMGR